MVINHNQSALFASRVTGVNELSLQKSMEKLSSGERINRAGDDAANLAVSEKMRSQIRGLNKASENAQNAVSFIQTAEGYLGEVSDILQRIRELAVQATNGVYSDEDRTHIQTEVNQLVSEIDRISSTAQFNGMNILTGGFENGIAFAIGANANQSVSINIEAVNSATLGLASENGDIQVLTNESANDTISVLDEAMNMISSQRANLGACQNRFEITKNGIDIAAENLQTAESRIRDTDMAKEIVEFTKNSILTSASIAMLSQANVKSEAVLKMI